MDNRRSDSSVTDAMLEREIERALAVDPSPEFVARVRTRIASEPAPSAWRFSWTLLAAASAAIVMIAAMVIVRQSTGQHAGPRESAPIAARPIGAASAFVSLAPATARRLLDVSPQRSPSAAPNAPHAPSEPEVLIALDESAALRRLMRGVRQGVVDPSTLADGLSEIVAIQPLEEIVLAPLAEISPITIAPLGSVAPEEGVRQ